MKGALKARRDRYEADRDLALMTAYFAGQLAQADWRRVPAFDRWLRSMTQPKRHATNAEIIARFEAMVMAGFDVTDESLN